MDTVWEDVSFASHFVMKLPVTPSCLFNWQCRVHRPPWLDVSTGQQKLLPDGDHSVGVTSAGTGFVTGCNGCVLMILILSLINDSYPVPVPMGFWQTLDIWSLTPMAPAFAHMAKTLDVKREEKGPQQRAR